MSGEIIMKILILLLWSILAFAQKADVSVGTDDSDGVYVRHWSKSYRPGSTDLVSAELDYEYKVLEAKSKGSTLKEWGEVRKTHRNLNYQIWKYNRFVERRNRLTKLKNEDVNKFLAKGNAATSRAGDETTLGFNIRTKKTQSDIKGEGLEILSVLKKDLRNLKTTPELPDKMKKVIDDQISDIERQEKDWRERKWYGPSDLTPEKIDKLQKELQGTSLKARAINTLWETHQKNLKEELEASIKANNDAKAKLSGSLGIGGGIGGGGRISRGRRDGGGIDITTGGRGGSGGAGLDISGGGRGISGGGGGISGSAGSDVGEIDGDLDPIARERLDRKTHNFNLALGDVFRKGELADLNGDFAFRNLNDWSKKIGTDVRTIQKSLRTNDDFIASMKNTPMGVFVDSQISKAFDGLCDKVRSCMVNDPNYLLKESLKGINESGRGAVEKDFLLGPSEGGGIRSPSGREK